MSSRREDLPEIVTVLSGDPAVRFEEVLRARDRMRPDQRASSAARSFCFGARTACRGRSPPTVRSSGPISGMAVESRASTTSVRSTTGDGAGRGAASKSPTRRRFPRTPVYPLTRSATATASSPPSSDERDARAAFNEAFSRLPSASWPIFEAQHATIPGDEARFPSEAKPRDRANAVRVVARKRRRGSPRAPCGRYAYRGTDAGRDRR